MNYIFIIGGLLLLVLGGNWLLKSSVGLSLKLNISKIVIGLTVVSIATSAPELIVSVNAAIDGFPNLALGNVVGSNIANIGLILGVVLLINSINVSNSFYAIDWPVKIIVSFLLFIFLLFDNDISRIEGMTLVGLYVVFIIYLIRNQNRVEANVPEAELNEMSFYAIFGFLVVGGFSLWAGSQLLIKGSISLAISFGVSERIIAVTVVSLGTSIPELVSSIIAALKNESDISIGNVIGSNIFNILGVLGITAIIKPIENIDKIILTQDIYWMLGFALLLMPLVILNKRGSLFFKEGILLLIGYIAFISVTIS